MPPIDMPTMCAFATPRASRRPTASAAISFREYGTSTGTGLPPNLASQVGLFLSEALGHAPSGALCVAEGRGNDARDALAAAAVSSLRSIAGLETPIDGEIVIAGQVVFSSRQKINVPAEKRKLSMVFQSYAIWPHMTVKENVGYGLRLKGVRGQDLHRRVLAALEMVGMAAFADRAATDLSGGQQQRVALARAYAFEPRAVLLDEPLSNLDARLRVRMRTELKELPSQLGLTTIYVTHDQEEAMAMSDRIIVMRDGKIDQSGAPLEIYDRPRSRFVADFVGAASILEAEVLGRGEDGGIIARVETSEIRCARSDVLPKPTSDGRHLIAVRTVYPEISATT